MDNKKNIDQLTAKIVDFVKPDKILLFGSQARGETSADSDYDFLIIAPSAEPRWKRVVPVYRLLAGSGLPKEIVWWTPQEINEWRKVKTHFINIVLGEGTILYEKSA